MKNRETKRKLPIAFFVITALFIAALLLRLAARLSRPFADAYNATVGAAFRAVTAAVTGWFPFSLAEILVLLLPIAAIVLITLAIRTVKKNPTVFRRTVAFILSIPMTVYFLFVTTYAVGYHTTPVAERLSLEDHPISASELFMTALYNANEAEKLVQDFSCTEEGTVMPYDWNEMTEKLNDAYAKLSEKYPFLQSHRTTLKKIMVSDAMTYTGIVGIYSFFTGESNVNTTYNDFSTVFTAAHEMAHQRGIAPENEANFIAYLALINADDDYLRYVGYANMTTYLMNALYSASYDYYTWVYAVFSPTSRTERAVYSTIQNAHRNETVRKVATTMNDSYLKAQGTKGSVSYGLVVDLAVDYYFTECFGG